MGRRKRIGATSSMRKNSRFDLTATRVTSPRPSFGLSAEGRRSQSARRSTSTDPPHVSAAPCPRSHVAFEVDGLGIVDPIQKSPLAVEELTPTSAADVDTPSRLDPGGAFHGYNDNDDCSHEEAQGVVEQRDVVAEQSDVPAQGDDDDDYNDDYNSDAQDESEHDYLEECF